MTSALVFETPGLVDLRSLTLMGTSAKPNSSSPIGRFGTGLKYSVACLVRMGTPPIIYIGRNRYEFRIVEDNFRGSNVELIELLGPRDRRELPYTTGYGAAWEPWMVYRELEANTIDEGGATYILDDEVQHHDIVASNFRDMGQEGMTRIIIPSETIVACHEDRDSVFLPGATREGGPLFGGGTAVEVFASPSRYLYWRGMRVYALPKPAKRTYNILDDMVLTEDRTLKDPWTAAYLIAQHIQRTDDDRLALDAIHATKEDYEGDLPYSDSYTPSETIIAEASKAAADGSQSVLSRHVGDYLVRERSRRPKAEEPDPFARWPRPWRSNGTSIIDANNETVLVSNIEIGAECSAMLDLVVATVNRNIPGSESGEEVF